LARLMTSRVIEDHLARSPAASRCVAARAWISYIILVSVPRCHQPRREERGANVRARSSHLAARWRNVWRFMALQRKQSALRRETALFGALAHHRKRYARRRKAAALDLASRRGKSVLRQRVFNMNARGAALLRASTAIVNGAIDCLCRAVLVGSMTQAIIFDRTSRFGVAARRGRHRALKRCKTLNSGIRHQLQRHRAAGAAAAGV